MRQCVCAHARACAAVRASPSQCECIESATLCRLRCSANSTRRGRRCTPLPTPPPPPSAADTPAPHHEPSPSRRAALRPSAMPSVAEQRALALQLRASPCERARSLRRGHRPCARPRAGGQRRRRAPSAAVVASSIRSRARAARHWSAHARRDAGAGPLAARRIGRDVARELASLGGVRCD